MPLDQFGDAVGGGWRTGDQGFAVQEAVDIEQQFVGSGVTPLRILFETANNDPVQISLQGTVQRLEIGVALIEDLL